MPKTVTEKTRDGRSKVSEENERAKDGGPAYEALLQKFERQSFIGIKELPETQRPRERLARLGARSLSDAELVAVLLGSGVSGSSALTIAAELTAGGGLYTKLATARKPRDLAQYRGLGKAKAATLLAAAELGRRIAETRGPELSRLSGPEEAYRYLAPKLRYLAKECFTVVLLNAKNKVLELEEVSSGSLTSVAVSVSDVFKSAIAANAAAIMVAHNHPSGDPDPSSADDRLTERLYRAGKLLGVPVLDHIIVGSRGYFSYKEAGRIIEE